MNSHSNLPSLNHSHSWFLLRIFCPDGWHRTPAAVALLAALLIVACHKIRHAPGHGYFRQKTWTKVTLEKLIAHFIINTSSSPLLDHGGDSKRLLILLLQWTGHLTNDASNLTEASGVEVVFSVETMSRDFWRADIQTMNQFMKGLLPWHLSHFNLYDMFFRLGLIVFIIISLSYYPLKLYQSAKKSWVIKWIKVFCLRKPKPANKIISGKFDWLIIH